MKRILFILLVVTASTTVMAGMSTSKVRKETRFLTDKMAYELDLNNPQYNDVYEINYDFIYSLRNIMDYVVRGDEWHWMITMKRWIFATMIFVGC